MINLMKAKRWFPILLLVLMSACTSEPNTVFDEVDEAFLAETQEEMLNRARATPPPPAGCDGWIGPPGNGPASGCVGNCPVPGNNFYFTISNLVCPTDDCYFTFRRRNSNLFEYPVYVWTCSGSGGKCLDQEGTYVYNNLLFNYGPLEAGVQPSIRYEINGFLGSWPNAQGNSVTLSWHGMGTSGSVDIEAFDGSVYPYNIYPVLNDCP